MTAGPTVTARPPRAWEIQTLILMAAVGASALLSMALLASDLAVRSFVLSGGASGMSPLVSAVIRHAGSINVLFLVLVLAYVVGFNWWRRATRRILIAAADRAGKATSHWTIPAWYLAIGTALVIRLQNSGSSDTPDAFATMLTWDSVQIAVRLAGLSLLLIGVWQIREQVRGLVAETGAGARRPARTTRLATPLGRPATPSAADLGPADDAFWQRVGQLAREAGSDLALLQTSGIAARRWALVPPAGDLTAIRAALPLGAIVTAFPGPPAATDTTTFVPAPADHYHGLLEDDQSGALAYQFVFPGGLPVFLNRARNARRWALYPTDSPAALNAVVKPG